MNPEQALIAREDAAALYRAMQRLSARYERVLRLWYGIGCEPMIFKDIGAQLGVVGGRVQQMARRAELRLRKLLMAEFRERPSVQRIRRELDEARQAEAKAREFAREQRAINAKRLTVRRVEEVLQESARVEQRKAERVQAERERQRRNTVSEILRIAEEVELELDQTPRQRKQRVVNPFGFSPERAAEYAEVLRALTLPHYRMRT